jgi:NitT/TauT family transport system ATP-binding protein
MTMARTTVPTPGLAAIGVSHAFGAQPVLGDVTFALPRARVGCLIGPSGCGKSTLLTMIGGMLAPASGVIVHDFHHAAFVFQDPWLLPWRNARDNIAFGLKALPIGRGERRARADRLLASVGLTAADADKFPHELSGGMRQRVALARALVVEPDLLLLDEPFSSLDVGLRRQMQTLVRRLIAGRSLTALMVTHDLAEAARVADRIFVMTPSPSRIVAQHDIACPFAERDDGFVHEEVGRLLADRRIALAMAVTERGGAAQSG